MMMDILLDLFISNAYAEPAVSASQGQGGGFSFIIMFVIFFLFIYFAVWRPQNKRAKEQQQLMNSLAKGDEVMTTGGIYGRISKMSDAYITLSVANNTDILMQKSSIVSVLPKGTLKALE
jgi:preprotein translocase subunit YajC